MSWDQVEDWLGRLADRDPGELATDDGLTTRETWRDAIDRIAQGLEAAAAVEGRPYGTAVVVVARTVLTAPLEWVALLLGHGTRVVLKHPRGQPGATAQMVAAAREVGLPLTATEDRSAIEGADLVVAMGSDETMDALRAAMRPDQRALLFGHRFSAAWVPDDRPEAWADVIEAVLPYDSRGCMSPQVVLTPVPLTVAVDRLSAAFTEGTRRRPRGVIGFAEGARIRARGALARVTGVDRTTTAWAVHGLPPEHWHPEALPYTVAVVHVSDRRAALEVLAPWARWLSTVGDDSAHVWFEARVCRIAEMQRPPLDRRHDGVDVLRSVVRTT